MKKPLDENRWRSWIVSFRYAIEHVNRLLMGLSGHVPVTIHDKLFKAHDAGKLKSMIDREMLRQIGGKSSEPIRVYGPIDQGEEVPDWIMVAAENLADEFDAIEYESLDSALEAAPDATSHEDVDQDYRRRLRQRIAPIIAKAFRAAPLRSDNR